MDWLGKVEHAPGLIRVQLSMDDRIGQFPRLVWEVADRLRSRGKPVTRGLSEAALEQGRHRQSQGYSTEMISEEFRVLKLSIFGALYDRLNSEEFRLVLSNAHTINDECDRQLRQTLASFTRRMARTAA
jgi:hypothetical protein